MPPFLSDQLTHAWAVLLLFLIPIGGGIPAGVLLAVSYGITWPITTLLYFISDVILALLFEPTMKLVIFLGKRVAFLKRFVEITQNMAKKSAAHYGYNTGPLALIMIAFGVDPMTGRAAAAVAGHGFLTGWMIAITGDMLYFVVIMACTLWLQSILGDGTVVMVIILGVSLLGPFVMKWFRTRRTRKTSLR